ncbi:MAG: pilin [Cardiobacteriaceae bacterium]|nr:pilin [Cardiobacteriaceae bacterium]
MHRWLMLGLWCCGLAQAYQPLRSQLPDKTVVYAQVEDIWSWLGDDESLQEAKSALRAHMQEHGFANLPEPLSHAGQDWLKYLSGKVELAAIGDEMKLVLAFAVADEKAGRGLVSALSRGKALEEKNRAGGAKRFVNQKECYEYEAGRLLVVEDCAWLEQQGAGHLDLPQTTLGNHELYVLNHQNAWYRSLDKQSQLFLKAFGLDTMRWLRVSYDKESKRLQLALRHDSEVLRQMLSSGQAVEAFRSLERVESALQWSMPSGEALMALNPMMFGALEQELKKAKVPVRLMEVFNALAGQWAWVREAGHGVFLWQGNRALFDQLLAKGQRDGWIEQRSLEKGITQIRYLQQTKTPETLMAATLLPNDIYFRDVEDTRIFASLPQILWEHDEAKLPLNSFGASPQSALWYGEQVLDLEKKSYYESLKWLRYVSQLSGQAMDLSALPMGKRPSYAKHSPLLIQLYQQNNEAILEAKLSHGLMDLVVWLKEQNAYGGAAGIGIMAAIALPAYQDYVSKAQLTQTVGALDAGKTLVDAAMFEGKNPKADLDANIRLLPLWATWGMKGFEQGTGVGYVYAEMGSKANSNLHGVTVFWKRKADGSWHCEIKGLKQARLAPKMCKTR